MKSQSGMMAKFQFQFETEHPILFLCDSTAPTAPVPELGDKIAVVSNDGVSFCVLSYVDGASLVTITDKHCELDGTRFADGVLNTPSGVLALSDSANFKYINIPVPKGSQSVEIWADELLNPTWVWIKLERIREY